LNSVLIILTIVFSILLLPVAFAALDLTVQDSTLIGGDLNVSGNTFLAGALDVIGIISGGPFYANVTTTSCGVGSFISAINNNSGAVTCTLDLDPFGGANVTTTSCAVGSYVSAVNNNTGVVTCTAEVGDNLGNHLATQDLNMSENNILNVTNIFLGTASTPAQLMSSGAGRLTVNGTAVQFEIQGTSAGQNPNFKMINDRLMSTGQTIAAVNWRTQDSSLAVKNFNQIFGVIRNTTVGNTLSDLEFRVSNGGGATPFLTMSGEFGQIEFDRQIDMKNNRINNTGMLNIGTRSELTIAAGVVTVTKSRHSIDTEADAPTDFLQTINGGTNGDLIFLGNAAYGRFVTVITGGNICPAFGGGICQNASLAQNTGEYIFTFNGTFWNRG